MMQNPKKKVVIVLTSTIVPNAIFVAHRDIKKRRQEYLKAIDYYAKFGEVFLLENSSYDVLDDPDFHRHPNVHIRKLPISKGFERGKGYQEFEMIDQWLVSEKTPFGGFIKITGRYFAQNFEELYQECLNERRDQIIIEQKVRRPIAHTCIFYTSKDYYLKNLLGLYRECNDSAGKWIEHVMREKLHQCGQFRTFKRMPLITGISGSSLNQNQVTLTKKIKYQIRRLIHSLYKKYRII